jgi:hypothetical protein
LFFAVKNVWDFNRTFFFMMVQASTLGPKEASAWTLALSKGILFERYWIKSVVEFGIVFYVKNVLDFNRTFAL